MTRIDSAVQQQLDIFDRTGGSTGRPSDLVALRCAIGFLALEVADLRGVVSPSDSSEPGGLLVDPVRLAELDRFNDMQRRALRAEEEIAELEARIRNQKEQIIGLQNANAELGRQIGPIPTHDQLVRLLVDEPEKMRDAVEAACEEDAGQVRVAAAMTLTAMHQTLNVGISILAAATRNDAMAIIANDGFRPRAYDGDPRCTCSPADNLDLDPDCPSHGKDSPGARMDDTPEPPSVAELLQTSDSVVDQLDRDRRRCFQHDAACIGDACSTKGCAITPDNTFEGLVEFRRSRGMD